MWRELLLTLGLLLVLEGIVPFLSPSAFRDLMARAARLDDATLRFLGLSSMLVGVLLVQSFN
jgi:uncharacterized protein YjeT (DUF2065 family)